MAPDPRPCPVGGGKRRSERGGHPRPQARNPRPGPPHVRLCERQPRGRAVRTRRLPGRPFHVDRAIPRINDPDEVVARPDVQERRDDLRDSHPQRGGPLGGSHSSACKRSIGRGHGHRPRAARSDKLPLGAGRQWEGPTPSGPRRGRVKVSPSRNAPGGRVRSILAVQRVPYSAGTRGPPSPSVLVGETGDLVLPRTRGGPRYPSRASAGALGPGTRNLSSASGAAPW